MLLIDLIPILDPIPFDQIKVNIERGRWNWICQTFFTQCKYLL